MRTRILTFLIAAGLMTVVLPSSAMAAKTATDTVTSASWGQGVAVVDPTVPANDLTPSSYAAINLKITLNDANGPITLTWDNGPDNVIGGCGTPVPPGSGQGCLPDVMAPGVYKFPYVAGTGGVVAGVGGHFNFSWYDAKGKLRSLSLPIQADTGFALLPAWAKP